MRTRTFRITFSDMEYYTVVADTYENAVRKAKSQYGDDIRIHSRRDYMTHGGIFTRRQPRCEIVCYSAGKVQKKDTKVQDKDMKEFEKEARTPDPSTLTAKERLDTEVYRKEDEDALSILSMNHITDPLRSKLMKAFPTAEDTGLALSDMLLRSLDIDYEHQVHPKHFVAFIGPTGSGKTTTLAKVAYVYSKQGKDVAIITLDTYRIGAYEQVKAFGDALSIPVLKAAAEDELLSAMESFEKKDIVFIDTMGTSPKDKELSLRLTSLMTLLGKDRTDLIMTIPATMKEEDMREQYALYSRHGKPSLAITKLDETETVGNVLSFAYSAELPIIFLTDGQRVPDDIEKASAKALIAHLKGIGLEMRNSESQLSK